MNDSTQNLIDLALGATLVGGSEEMAKELLTMLLNSLPDHRQEITQAFDSNDLDALRKAAHKLHGATCYTGTPALKAASSALENAAKEEQADKLDALYQELMSVIDATVSAEKAL